MKKEMFFGEVPNFDEILRVVGDFERKFNLQAGQGRLDQELIPS